MATQTASLAGALLILAAYLRHQLRWLDSRRPLYNLANLLGAAVLAWIALRPRQAGFAVMEVTWTFTSLASLLRSLQARRTAVAG